MKLLYINYDPADNVTSAVVDLKNEILELKQVGQTDLFQNEMNNWLKNYDEESDQAGIFKLPCIHNPNSEPIARPAFDPR